MLPLLTESFSPVAQHPFLTRVMSLVLDQHHHHHLREESLVSCLRMNCGTKALLTWQAIRIFGTANFVSSAYFSNKFVASCEERYGDEGDEERES